MDEFSVREWRRMALSRAGRGWSTVMAPRRHFLQQKIGCHGCRTTGPGWRDQTLCETRKHRCVVWF